MIISSFCGINAVQAASVAPIDCNAPLESTPIYTVLDNERNTLSGWSHIRATEADNNENEEYQALSLSWNNYAISQSRHVNEVSCRETKVQNAILVVKLSDWTRQHSNGFETLLDQPNIRFGDVSHVLIDLRLNGKGTAIPSPELLRKRYGNYLSEEEFDEFDHGKANLGVTLFEDGALDQSTTSLNAEYFLEIDQQRYFDQWLRIVIPITEFHAYLEKDYARTTVEFEDFTNTLMNGLRINPETRQGKQLRNFLGDQWNASLPETFKEMSVSIRRVELLKVDKEKATD